MRIEYYINREGDGVITGGTPCAITRGKALELAFGTEYDGATCIVNCRRYTVKNGVCTIPAVRLSPLLEIALQVTKACTGGSVTRTFVCEPLQELGGELVGATENTDYSVHLRHFAQLKHKVMLLDRELEARSRQLAELEAKCEELERKLNGTDIFALREVLENDEETENTEETKGVWK